LADLTAEGFETLLQRLDADQIRAAEKYEELRMKLVKFYSWRGCPDASADELADETINRVAAKLVEGIEIESLNAYACQISRFVWLEFSRKRKEDNYGDEMPEQAVEPEIAEEPDERLNCLKKCLAEITKDDEERKLIIGYYDRNAGEKQKEARKSLAEKFGLQMNALKVKACRLRVKLEKCITDCVAQM
jgi:DNA-directed RNA polymerase specialized sigma24 family protein